MALTKKLEAIGDSIRSKTGTTEKMTLDEMKDAIDGIGSVPAPPDEAFVVTGDCAYRFSNGGWDWFIENYSDKITTKDINRASSMFAYNKLSEIPFEINFKQDGKNGYVDYCFQGSVISKLPKINWNNSYIVNFCYMFSNCHCLTEMPNDYFKGINFDRGTPYVYGMFSNCTSLRKIADISIFDEINGNSWSDTVLYDFSNLHALDELTNAPLLYKKPVTSNIFSLDNLNRLKRFVFKQYDFPLQMKSQTIGLSSNIGYAPGLTNITRYSAYHGITEATRVTDDTSYQALKDNPDWWTTDIAYSRYNHDSAVETINSLPDTSAYLAAKGGTNTIKFKGAAGSKTDGGAINTLTEEEIAVATAKGWTVTLV